MLKAMVIRNLKLFRDKAAVFFSLLWGLDYYFFIYLVSGTLVVEMARGFSDVVAVLTDSWVMAGVIASTSMTTCLGGWNHG